MKSSSTTRVEIMARPGGAGSSAVNTAPSSLRTLTRPPRRAQTIRMRARPIPRWPSAAALVVKPCSKTSSASSGATPGPESRTITRTVPFSWAISTATQPSGA